MNDEDDDVAVDEIETVDDEIKWVMCLHVGFRSESEYARIRATGEDHDGNPVSINLIACRDCAKRALRKLQAKIRADTELKMVVEEGDDGDGDA